MTIADELLQTVQCPDSRQPLRLADEATVARLNERIAAGELLNRGGSKVENPLDGGLVREDGKVLYPVIDDIPILLVEEGIEL